MLPSARDVESPLLRHNATLEYSYGIRLLKEVYCICGQNHKGFSGQEDLDAPLQKPTNSLAADCEEYVLEQVHIGLLITSPGQRHAYLLAATQRYPLLAHFR